MVREFCQLLVSEAGKQWGALSNRISDRVNSSLQWDAADLIQSKGRNSIHPLLNSFVVLVFFFFCDCFGFSRQDFSLWPWLLWTSVDQSGLELTVVHLPLASLSDGIIGMRHGTWSFAQF